MLLKLGFKNPLGHVGLEEDESGLIRIWQTLNVTDKAQSNSLIVAYKCSESGHLLVLPALPPFLLLGNNSPNGHCLSEVTTRYQQDLV
jgi:hypothetical protein